mmetsp:Transcript_10542/g.11990  ORF Transcript_10542/g.11990 Transcript_10542/m.11990 type:complete len:97 (+) Transcript_10542:232-522(+)
MEGGDNRYQALHVALSRLSQNVSDFAARMEKVTPLNNKMTDLGNVFDSLFNTNPNYLDSQSNRSKDRPVVASHAEPLFLANRKFDHDPERGPTRYI